MQHWREDASGIVKSILCSPCIKESLEGFLLGVGMPTWEVGQKAQEEFLETSLCSIFLVE